MVMVYKLFTVPIMVMVYKFLTVRYNNQESHAFSILQKDEDYYGKID